jgi:hypothetical protein
VFYSDWNKLVNAANKKALCGYSDWRVPRRSELINLMNFNANTATYYQNDPTLDVKYFKNIAFHPYWTASAYAAGESDAWTVEFNYDSPGQPWSRSNFYRVMLVRGN